MKDDPMYQMRKLSRQHLKMVWDISGLDESMLSSEDQVLLEVMRRHPEYYDLWGRLDSVTEQELERDGTNPIIHVMIHQTLENQIAANKPPEVARTVDRLMSSGKTRHDALHEIGVVLIEEIFEIMKFNRPFNQRLYTKKLRQLGRLPKKQQKSRR